MWWDGRMTSSALYPKERRQIWSAARRLQGVCVSPAAETIPALILGKDLQLPPLLCQGSCSSLAIPVFLFYISPFPLSGSISGLLWLLKWLDLLKFIFSSCDLCNSLFHPICIRQSSLVQVKSGSCSTNQKWSDKMDECEMSKWEELSILLWVPELCTLSALPPSAVSPRCAHSSNPQQMINYRLIP